MHSQKILILRTLGGNVTNHSKIQMSHHNIWDNMNNGLFGIADYYKNIDESATYDIYEQILQYNRNQVPNWLPNDFAFAIGIYTNQYVKRAKVLNLFDQRTNHPSLLLPFQSGSQDFLRHNQRGGQGIDISFTFNSKINSIDCISLDKLLVKRKRQELGISEQEKIFDALCFSLEKDFIGDLLTKYGIGENK